MNLKVMDGPNKLGDMPGFRRIEPMNTELSEETKQALKAIDDNIRSALIRAPYILVGGA